MESHRCASATSNHSEGTTGNHEQLCSQMPQQMIYNAASQGHFSHPSSHNHLPPQQSHMAVPQQQYISAEPNIHHGQAQAKQIPADLPPVCSASTGDVSLRGQLMSSVQPNIQTYSETNSHQRHIGAHEGAAPACGNMTGPVMSMPGQVFHSPNVMHQNVQGMIVTGHIPTGDGRVPHGNYYPAPQRMQNSGHMSWHSHGQYIPAAGQGSAPGQVYVSGAQIRHSSQMTVPFRAQHPHYPLSQEYGEAYCQQYHPLYGELNSGISRGTFPPQQHCIGPNGQQIMFARPSMHSPHHHPHMPADARFVYYSPHGASQQLSPSWSGLPQVMRPGVPVRYSNQPGWQQPVAVAYGGPLPGQRMPGYHLSPEPRMNSELCDNFGGARQHSSPSHSFSPGLVRCYRPPSRQGVHTGMVSVDDKFGGTCHVPADRNLDGTLASQEYVSSVVSSTSISTVTVCTTVSNVSSENDNVVTLTTTASHALEHLPEGIASVPHNTCARGTAVPPSLSSFNHPSYYARGPNMNTSWSVSCSEEYYSYSAASQYSKHQHAGQHVNSHNYYGSRPCVPYSGIPHYPMSRCGHPYQAHSEQMSWQGHVAEHFSHECKNVLPDDTASRHHLEQESLTSVTITTSCEPSSVTAAVDASSIAFSPTAPVPSCKVEKQNLGDTDKVLVERTIPLQSIDSNSGSHVPLSGSAYHVQEHCVTSSSVAISVNCTAVTQVVVTATCALVTLPASSVHMIPSKDPEVHPANDTLLVQDKNVAVPRPETESQNSLQVTSSAFSSTCKSSKGPKRGGSRKATTKTKKKKKNYPLDTGEPCSDSAVVTCTDAVKCTALESLCSSSGIINAVSHPKIMPGLESGDTMCPVTPSGSEQAAVVVPYGWRRHVDNGIVAYYRLHSLIYSHCAVNLYIFACYLCKIMEVM